jgi:hypothetical protein
VFSKSSLPLHESAEVIADYMVLRNGATTRRQRCCRTLPASLDLWVRLVPEAAYQRLDVGLVWNFKEYRQAPRSAARRAHAAFEELKRERETARPDQGFHIEVGARIAFDGAPAIRLWRASAPHKQRTLMPQPSFHASPRVVVVVVVDIGTKKRTVYGSVNLRGARAWTARAVPALRALVKASLHCSNFGRSKSGRGQGRAVPTASADRPLSFYCRHLAASPRTAARGNVWTAPGWQ